MAGDLRRWVQSGPERNGEHPDPLDPGVAPPDPARWSPVRRAAFESDEMELFRGCLLVPGASSVRDAVLDELAEYHGLDAEECRRRCLGWEAESVREWSAGDRASDAGRLDFYRHTESWSFDLLWFSYLQAEGHAVPQAVIALRDAARGAPGRRHLDFGSGTGTTSQLFAAAGYATELADVSSTLLAFARHRLDRRGVAAGYRDLGAGADLGGPYDVITALDTLAHVPDVYAAARRLHGALAPEGLLYAGIDARPPTPENAWHLVDDELAARVEVERAGFRPEAHLGDQLVRYRRVDPDAPSHRVRVAVKWAAFGSWPAQQLRRAVRATVRRARPVRDRLRRRPDRG